MIFVDRQSHFGLESIKAGIPLFVYLRGHFWMEQEWAKKTIYKDPIMKTVVDLRTKNAEKVQKRPKKCKKGRKDRKSAKKAKK